MLDLFSRGRLIAGFGRHADGRATRTASTQPAAAQVLRGHRAHPQGVDEHRAVRLQRRVQQAPLRQSGAAPYQQPHPRSGFRAAGRWRRGTTAPRTTSSTAPSPTTEPSSSARPSPDTGTASSARQGLQPEPARGHPVRRRRRHRRRGLPALQGAAEYFFNRSLHVYPASPDPPAMSRRRRCAPATRARCAPRPGQAGGARPELRRDGRQRLRRARQPRHGARAARGGGQGPQHREPVRCSSSAT